HGKLATIYRMTFIRTRLFGQAPRPRVSLLMRRPGAQGRTAVERVIRVVAANERVKVTQSAIMRAPSVETEVNALRAEEEQAEATAAYVHHHLKPPRTL